MHLSPLVFILTACFPSFDEQKANTFVENRAHDFDQDGFTEEAGDCNDSNKEQYPGAQEVCDGLDNDCNGAIDDQPIDIQEWYEDVDGDGFGTENSKVLACELSKPDGYVEAKFRDGEVAFDCDDTRSDVSPDSPEVCDDVDNDCNGDVDDYYGIDGEVFYLDRDADGYGDLSSAMYACPGHEPDGYIEQPGDCDDDAASNHPDAIEVCDGEDNNCNGVIDEPTAADVTLWYQDSDGDGFGSMVVSQPSCTQPSGYVADNTDCNDNEATAYVGADEYCNGYDDNCDGAVDENTAVDASLYYPDSDGDGYGATVTGTPFCYAQSGYVTNNTDCNDAVSTINPAEDEVCNNLDDDCDGGTDDLDPDDTPLLQLQYYIDADGDEYGDALQPVLSCPDYSNGVAVIPSGLADNDMDCNDSADDLDGDGILDGFEIHPSADELCTEFIDENCDGLPMVGAIDTPTYYADFDFDGHGNESYPVQVCQQPYGYVLYEPGHEFDCDDTDALTYPSDLDPSSPTYATDLLAEELCNGRLDRCENDPSGGLTLPDNEIDGDGDGFVDCVLDVDPAQWADSTVTVLGGEDCDDGNALFYPDKHWYYDSDGDGWGITSIVEIECTQPSGYVDQTEDCNDSSAFTFPGAAPLTDPLACLTDADGDGEADRLWALCDQFQDTDNPRIEVTTPGNTRNVVNAGDVDGDGLDDVLMYVSLSYVHYQSGVVYLFLGSTLQNGGTLDAANSDYILFPHGGMLTAFFGTRMSTAGDVDGDGLDDILIASQASGGFTPSVHLFLGASFDPATQDVSTATANYSFIGEFADDNVNMSVGYAGDVDGDGLGDILVGAPTSNRVYLFFGATLDPSQQQVQLADADYIFVGNPGDDAGVRVSGLGDVDGDGLDDIGIGAQYSDDGATNGGKGYVVFAASLDPTSPIVDLNTADYQLIGTDVSKQISEIRGGDVDGDGLSDIVMSGIRGGSYYHIYSMKAYIVLGSTLSTSSSSILLSDADYTFNPSHTVGIRGFDMGDADGDGLQDIVFGQSLHDLYGEGNIGRVNLFLGASLPALGASISLDDADYIFTGVPGQGGALGNQGLQWGYSFALSDFDGDGQADVFMGGTYSHSYTAFSPCEN